MPISATGSEERGDCPSWDCTLLPNRGQSQEGQSPVTGFTFLKRYAEHGFTLIELMTVLAILGLASAAVLFAVPSGDASVREDAERFAARVSAARDLAIVNSRPLRLTVTGAGYAFAVRHEGKWLRVPEKVMQETSWAAGTQVGGQGVLMFDVTGGTSAPLLVKLVKGDDGATVSVDASGASHVSQ
jgi:general secretion pathway protein H